MPSFSQKSLEKLNTCDPRLVKLFIEVVKHVDCTILEGHRGKEAQDAAVAAGNSKTPWPTGKHNSIPSKAVDAAPYPVDFNNPSRFYLFAGFVRGIASQMGIKIRIGADWDGDFDTKDQSLIDLPHFEILD